LGTEHGQSLIYGSYMKCLSHQSRAAAFELPVKHSLWNILANISYLWIVWKTTTLQGQ